MQQPYFIVHNEKDSVGVTVKEVKAGETLEGWVMSNDATVSVTAKQDIKIGHKIALNDVAVDTMIINTTYPSARLWPRLKKWELIR